MTQAEATALVVHGGAGTLTRETITERQRSEYQHVLHVALNRGHEILMDAGGSSIDAVAAAVVAMEESELFNAGRGSVLTSDERIEMDASIMEGLSLRAGAVAGVTRIRNPVVAAREVMLASDHVMLIGSGAESFAEDQGLELKDNAYFVTERRLEQLQRVRESGDKTTLSEHTSDKFGTVGAVARDREGTLAAATSTGGMTNKQFGRVGDSPIIGAGTYADNGTCAISATGHGEFFIRAAVAHDIVSRMRYLGEGMDDAMRSVVHGSLLKLGGRGGVIGVDSNGRIAMAMNTTGMYRGWVDGQRKTQVRIFADE